MEVAARLWEVIDPDDVYPDTIRYTDDVETAEDAIKRGLQVTEYQLAEEHPLRRCPNCDTITELVTEEYIAESLASRVIAAEDTGWKRGEERFAAGVALARMELDTALAALARIKPFSGHRTIRLCVQRARVYITPNIKRNPDE